MRQLTSLEEAIYNHGECLIPGVTHDLSEVVRHRSSYVFFRKVIESDLAIIGEESRLLQVVDLGCGVGHGCYTLSEIPNSHIMGIDSSPERLEYARCHYARANITYQLADLVEFIPAMPEYDYVTSRGVFEHVPNGLHLAASTKWRYRLLFDVPYDEPRDRNPHHVVHNIREEDFSGFSGVELFFEDRGGVIYDVEHKPTSSNMIMCVCSHPDLPRVSDRVGFPLPAWQPELGLRIRYLNWPKVIRRPRRTARKWLGLIRVLTR
jgi:SAM-dependent methyltransferase